MKKEIKSLINQKDELDTIFKEVYKKLDKVIQAYWFASKNWELITSWESLQKEYWQNIELIKQAIKQGNLIEETKYFKIKVSSSHKIDIEEFKKLAWEEAKNYIVLEEKIPKKAVDKAIKAWDLPEKVKQSYKLSDCKIYFNDKEKILTEITV